MSTLRRSSSSYGAFGDGLIIRQVPIVNMYGGNVYWVDSSGGGGSKGTFAHPVATLAEALVLCTDSNGDQIYIKPYHAETVLGAGGITLNKIGVDIIGLGHYTSRPRFLMDGSTITGLVTAADMSVSNCVFAAGHADIACAFLVTAKGFTMDNCDFIENVATENFIAVIQVGASDNDGDGFRFTNNNLNFGTDVAVLQPVDLVTDTKDAVIAGNKIIGDFDTTAYAAIYSVNSKDHLNLEIAYNLIWNQHSANACICISAGGSASTGWMHHNLAKGDEASGSTPFVAAAGGLALFENYYVGDDSVSGYILPAIGAN
jgi:hypothetical protein